LIYQTLKDNRGNKKRTLPYDCSQKVNEGLKRTYDLNHVMPKDLKIPITCEWKSYMLVKYLYIHLYKTVLHTYLNSIVVISMLWLFQPKHFSSKRGCSHNIIQHHFLASMK
jgi:hypothetical protein